MTRLRVAFLVNPVAGIGGRVALKGSDGLVEEALRRGGSPLAPGRALAFLKALGDSTPVDWIAAPGAMGQDILEACRAGRDAEQIPMETGTSRADTARFLEGPAREADLLLFVGGDGTARDVAQAWRGVAVAVPGGVKMFSECFAVSPQDAARAVAGYRPGDPVREAEVADVDEEAYRQGRLQSRPWGVVRVPDEAALRCSKCPLTAPASSLEALAGAFLEEVKPGAVYVLGAGTTLAAIKRAGGLEPSLLGEDVARGAAGGGFESLVRDASERDILQTLDEAGEVWIVVTPTGGQGFLLGRGTAQISPEVLRRVGVQRVRVVAPREKLMTVEALRVDTGDPELDAAFPSHLRVLTGPGQEKLMRIAKGQQED